MNCMVSGSQAKSGIAVKTVYAKFAYMQIWSCEQKAKFAHVSIYLIMLNNC